MIDPAPTVRLVLVRHGESNVTVERVIGGARSCSGLSPLGREQSRRLQERLERTGELAGARLVSSHFERAIETARIIAPGVDEGIDADAIEQIVGFGEHDPGPDLDGVTFDDYVERFGVPDWDGDPDVEIFPGGETTAQFHRRVHAALDELLGGLRSDGTTDDTVVIACHGGVVDATFRRLLGMPVTGSFELHTVNTSITEFASTPGGNWRVVRYNDAAHLEGLPVATPRT